MVEPVAIVVLDACVLYPMYLRDTLLRAAEQGLYRVCWSSDILDEVRRNLVADGRLTSQRAQRLVKLMRTAFPEAEVTNYQRLIASLRTHPKDRHVLAAAITCGASVIVTDNLNDFPVEALAPYAIEAKSADSFLNSLLARDPEALFALIVAQAADYTYPTMAPIELLERLAKAAPTFAQRIQQLLSSQAQSNTSGYQP